MATESNEATGARPGRSESFVGRALLLVPLYLLGYIPGLICNIRWFRQAHRIKKETGKAPWGHYALSRLLLLGIVPPTYLVFAVIFGVISHIVSPPRPVVSRIRSEHRSLATAIEAYKLDHGVYPAHTFDRRETVGARTAAEFEARHGRVPTFRTRGTTELHTLTTPVDYIPSIFGDAFLVRQFRDHGYAYYTDGGGWLIWSPGPDGEYAIKDPSEVYTSEVSQPSLTLLLHAYDPTNGTTSPGDVFRVAQ